MPESGLEPSTEQSAPSDSVVEPSRVEPSHTPPPVPDSRHTRISAAWVAVAVTVILGVALIAFIVQNTRSVQIKFFGASGHVPLAVALLAAALIGAIIVLAVGISRVAQLRISARRRWKRSSEEEANAPGAPLP